MGASSTQTLQILLTTDGQGNVTAALNGVVSQIKQIKPASDEASSGLDKIASSIDNVKRLMGAWGVYEVLKEAVTGFLEANAAAQQLQATLIAVTGSAAEAQGVYADLVEISQSTTSSTSELVGAYVRLQNAGLQPTNELLSSMANIAVGTGTTVDQVANAMAMAYEGNARGLKQLGIVAQEAGGKIVLSFQGQKTVIDNSAAGLTDFFNKFGQSDQFVAAQQASVNSLGGAWHQFWKQLEEDAVSGNGLIGGTISLLTKLIQLATATAKGQDKNSPEYVYNNTNGGVEGLGAGEGGAALTAPSTQYSAQGAQDQLNILKQITSETGLTNVATEVYNDTLRRLAESFGAVTVADQAEKKELEDAAAATALANKATSDLTDKLKEKAATIGSSAVQAVQYALSAGKMADADNEHRVVALSAAKAVDAATAAQKAKTQAETDANSDKSLIQSLTEQVAAFGQDAYGAALAREQLDLMKVHSGAAAEQVTDLTVQLLNQIAAQKTLKDQMQEDDSLQKLLNELDPVSAAYTKFFADLVLIDDEFAKGKISPDAYSAAIKALGDGLGDAITKADSFGKSWKSVMDEIDPEQSAFDKLDNQLAVLNKAFDTGKIDATQYFAYVTDAFKKFSTTVANDDGAKKVLSTWESVGGTIGDTLSKLMVDGVKNGGKDMLAATTSIAKELEDYWIKQKIVVPLEQKATAGGDGSASSGLLAGGAALFQTASEAASGQTGAAVGSLVGAIIGTALDEFTLGMGTVIGSMIGGLVGGLFDSTKTPQYTVYGQNNIPGGAGQYTDSLGTFGIVGQHGSDDTNTQVQQKIQDFDNSIAQFLPPDQVDRVKAALAAINTSMKGTDPTAIEQAHLDAVIAATDPAFQKFIDNINDVTTELAAFQALEKLQADLKTTASTITQLTGTPLQKLQDSLKTLQTGVTNAATTLATALATQDPTQVLTAEQALKKAITDRYTAEMTDVQNLITAEQSLEDSSYSLNLSLAQKIGSLTGDMTGAISTAADRMSTLKAQVLSDTDYGTALNDLSQLQQATDDWLSAAQQQIENNFNSQIQAIEDQKTALQNQASAQSSASGSESAAAQAAHEKKMAALQQELTLAQAWVGVLQSAQQMIQDLQTSAANPLGGYSQLDIINQTINQKFASLSGETGTQQETDASALLTDLQQRLTIIEQGNLYDKTSPDYMAAYNQTLSQIAQIQALANPYTQQATDLQKQLDALGAVKTAVSSGFSVNSGAIDALNAQEDALKAQEQTQLDALNQQAAAYYTWEQGEAAALEAAQHKEIMSQLDAITGGVDPTQFIAEESSNMAASLNSIDSQITAFLAKISGATSTSSGGSSSATGGAGGNSGTGSNSPSPITRTTAAPIMSVTVNVNAAAMSAADVSKAVVSELNRNMPAMASKMKRALKNA